MNKEQMLLEKKPKISMIMLVHNRENLVERAIKCALNQSFSSYELIIIDNASSDGSYEVCKKYESFTHVSVYKRADGSIAKGRNFGTQVAKGEYITFVDDDDFFENDLLETLYTLIETFQSEGCIVGSNKMIGDEILPNCAFEGRYVMTAEEAIIQLLTRKKMNAALPTKMFRRDLFERIKFDETGKYDDITFTYKIMAEASQIAADGTPKYCFYRHEENHSKFTTNDQLLTPSQLEEYLKAFKERTAYLGEKMPTIHEFVQYTEWSYMISMCHKIISNDLRHCQQQLDYMRNSLTMHSHVFYTSQYIKDFEKEWMKQYIGVCHHE